MGLFLSKLIINIEDLENQNVIISNKEENVFLQNFNKTITNNPKKNYRDLFELIALRTAKLMIKNLENLQLKLNKNLSEKEKYQLKHLYSKFCITSKDDNKSELYI